MVVDRHKVTGLKWGALLFILLFNVAVIVLWVPASLQISPKWIKTHSIFDRIKQAVLAFLDLAANWYFLHVVRCQLISNGLTKYTRLFWNNVFMIAIALALDVSIVLRYVLCMS